MNYSFEKIAELVGGKVIGHTSSMITNFNRIEFAEEGEISFLSNPKFEKFLKTTQASCVLVPDTIADTPKDNQVFIAVNDPYFEFVRLLKIVDAELHNYPAAIHHTAVIAPSAKVHKSAFVGAYSVIGENCQVGENTVIHPHVVLFDDVKIGDNCILYPYSVFREDTIVGNNCIIHCGAVIGDDGFGYIEHKDGSYEKIPQLGNVILEDNVEIGANTTIDRAMSGHTVVGKGAILDNLVQIGHNVIIGENSAMAAQVGVAGTCKIGKRNRFGGQVGLAGHLDTCDDVVLIAQSGVAKTITEKGVYFGSPVKDRVKAFKIESSLLQLPDLIKEFQKMKKLLEEKGL